MSIITFPIEHQPVSFLLGKTIQIYIKPAIIGSFVGRENTRHKFYGDIYIGGIIPVIKFIHVIIIIKYQGRGQGLYRCGGILTDYGLIERTDGQPVQSIENQPKQGGMEMK